jgi:hypothetical protein
MFLIGTRARRPCSTRFFGSEISRASISEGDEGGRLSKLLVSLVFLFARLRGERMASQRQESRSSTRLPFAIRNLPVVVIRSLPPRSAMYPSPISRAPCSAGITAGGSVTADVSPTVRSEANSSRVSVSDFLAIVREYGPFRNSGVINFAQIGE